ncbi:MAG: DEAD/DEAH box helicase [Prolixibacteraceae bacterium]
MSSFENFNLSKQLQRAIADLGFEKPTPIQEEAFSVILSGKDVVGVAQTGTGKTFAYMLPLLMNFKFSNQINPRILILVPTRELVLQMVEMIESYTAYMSVRVLGVYGGTNINVQKAIIAEGCDIMVATPGRIYDLTLDGALQLKSIKKLVVDEVDVMLDLGFIYQLTNIIELLPERRQNIMFSATMTDEVADLIEDFFVIPHKISIAISGERLENISQVCYPVKNFYTKQNLLSYLLKDKAVFTKVLVFVPNKKSADHLFEELGQSFGTDVCVIHSNKSQNYRIRSIQEFDEGKNRILIATDVMSRGLDFDKISHVINFDTPHFPENYIHRIGRTGRVEANGESILFYTETEKADKEAIEALMGYSIPVLDFPEEVEISSKSTPEEVPRFIDPSVKNRKPRSEEAGPAFHEKKLKNTKTDQGPSYLRKMKVYKKPQKRGDKIANLRKKK